MACLLTSDFTFLGCKGGLGGIKKVYMTEWGNLSGAGSTSPVVTAGVIGTWVLATGKEFRTYTLDSEFGKFTNPLTVSDNGAITYEPTIEFTINGLIIANFIEINLIAKNYLCMMVLDENGKYYAFGVDRPMGLATATTDSNMKLEEGANQVLSFKGKQSVYIYEVSSSLITALTTPTP